jgi:hypothetical protein
MHFTPLLIALSSLIVINATPLPQEKNLAPFSASSIDRGQENLLGASDYDLDAGHISNLIPRRRGGGSRPRPVNNPKSQDTPMAPKLPVQNTLTAPDTPTVQNPPTPDAPTVQTPPAPQTPKPQNGVANGIDTAADVLESAASIVSIAANGQAIAQNSNVPQDVPVKVAPVGGTEAVVSVEVSLFSSVLKLSRLTSNWAAPPAGTSTVLEAPAATSTVVEAPVAIDAIVEAPLASDAFVERQPIVTSESVAA